MYNYEYYIGDNVVAMLECWLALVGKFKLQWV